MLFVTHLESIEVLVIPPGEKGDRAVQPRIMGKKNKKKSPAQSCNPQQNESSSLRCSKQADEAVKPKITKTTPEKKQISSELSKKPGPQKLEKPSTMTNRGKDSCPEQVKNKDSCLEQAKNKPAFSVDNDKEVLKGLAGDVNNSEAPITLKDLVSAITKAASDRKKAAGSSKKDSELKEELGSLLRQIKLDDGVMNSPLASEKPLSNEEGLSELMSLLGGAKPDPPKASRSTSADSSPTIAEALLDSTNRAQRLGAQGSTESESAKDDSGSCQFCELEATTKCTGCRKVFYCSRECQRSHWNAHKDVCRPYKVGKIEGFGRVLVSTRALMAGEEVLQEKPFVVGPRPSAETICLGCYRRVSGSYRCGACKWAMCGEECARSPHHAVECGVASAAGLTGADAVAVADSAGHHYELVTALRCLVASEREGARWRALLDRFGARHRLVLAGSMQHLRHQQAIVEPLRTAFKIHTQPELRNVQDTAIHTVLNVLQVHSVPCRSSYGEVSGLYPMASLLGHSCVPNTKTRFQGEHLVVTATEAIPPGSALTAMFTDILWGTKARRDHLLQTRFFSCPCRRCLDPTELGSYFSALVCPKCPERQPVLPTKPLVSTAPWACVTCKYPISGDDLLETNLTLGAEASEQLGDPSIHGLEGLLDKWLPRVHTNHYHLHAIKHSLLQLYGRANEKDEKKDEAYWREIAKKEQICQEFLKVCSLLDPSMAHSVPQFGLAFYELHKTVLQYAKRNFGLAKLGTQQLKKKMQLAKALLRRSMDILQHEAEDSPEGQLYLRCQEEFIAIGKWMLAVGLV